MSSVLCNKTNGYLFTWEIKNINVSFYEERIISPKFVTYNFENCDWVMSFHPFRKRDGFKLNLEVTDSNLMPMESIEVVLTLAIVASDGKEVVLNKAELISFDVGGELIEVASVRRFLYHEDTLIFNCHIESLECSKATITRCLAFTHVGSEKRCCIWKVRNFANLLPDKQKKYTLFSTASEFPEINVLGTLSKESKFIIEVHVLSAKRIFIVGKISVLTSENDLKWSKVKGFLVEDGSTSKMVFKFPLKIIRSCVLKDLHNGDLHLLCEFSTSTGKIHSEIVESNYINKEHFDLLKRRVINTTIENSALNVSSAGTEKILTPDTDGAIFSNESNRTPQTLKEDLKCFYLQKNHCDVTFQIGTEMLEAHKSILCSRSPVFSAMFDSDMKETINKKVEIVDMDADTLDRFLLFLYSETLEDLSWDTATKLLYAANKYQVESLKVECTSFLVSNISEVNVCEALKLSDLYQDEKLKSACQNVIFTCEAKIFSSKEWETLTVENPLLSARTLQTHFAMKK